MAEFDFRRRRSCCGRRGLGSGTSLGQRLVDLDELPLAFSSKLARLLVLLSPLVCGRASALERLAGCLEPGALVGDLRRRVGGNLAGEPGLEELRGARSALLDPVDFRLGRPDVPLGAIERQPGLCDRRLRGLVLGFEDGSRFLERARFGRSGGGRTVCQVGCIGERRKVGIASERFRQSA